MQGCVADQEELGRGVFSSSAAAKATRSLVPFSVFLEKKGEQRISVDRLSKAPTNEAVLIAEKTAAHRQKPFFGWAVVTAANARKSDRRVRSTPIIPDNRYHADIVLPESAIELRDEQKQHAQELRDLSIWRPKPQVS